MQHVRGGVAGDLDFSGAAERLRGVVRRTPLEALDGVDERLDLRVKLECLQETGSFKARGAWNQIAQLGERERAAGVVTTSSGNHGKALAWAAQRAGVRATIVMPADAYPNKIQACRDFGAQVELAPTRPEAERICADLVERGATLVHPYDSERTVQGAGTVGLEIAEEWPEVEVVIVPVGGGGLIGGCALALRERLGERVVIVGAEPQGAPTMTRALAAGEPVFLDRITTAVQGLCPLSVGALNLAIAQKTVAHTVLLSDEEIFAAQAELVGRGWVVEPAGAAAFAVAWHERLPDALRARLGSVEKLRVAAVVSGGNPDPAQLAGLRRPGK
jgi:threonine dehydratase